MDLGRRAQLYPHDAKWMSQASHESSRLVQALGGRLDSVHHIGSTAIAGIKAKPTIDLLGVCRSLDALDARADDMRDLGYEWRGEFGIPGRRFCVLTARGDEHPRFHLHIFDAGSSHVRRHLAFCEYLGWHADEARAYEREKLRAAALHPDDTLAYNKSKSSWIKECDIRALNWLDSTAVKTGHGR